MAKREVLKTLQLLGMLPALVKNNILILDRNDIICLNTPGLGTFAVWELPDEIEIIPIDELLDLDSEVFLAEVEEHCENPSNALTDLAATTCLQSEQEGSDEEDEEDSPTHCALYKGKRCKYQDRRSNPLKT